MKFDLNSLEVRYLKQSDSALGTIIDIIGPYRLELRTDYYRSLVFSIVGQQLSSAVAKVIKNRLLSLCGEIRPDNLLNCSDEALREAGISRPKIIYIRNLSSKVLEGELDLESISEFSDAEIISQLTRLKGIGTWTAEMFLIFSLGRLNVLSVKDVGLQRAIKWLYQLGQYPDELTMKNYKILWDPYCTVASLYLWEIINTGMIAERRDFGNDLL